MELSILRNYQQIPDKIGENKNRNNTFDIHQFINCIDGAFIYFSQTQTHTHIYVLNIYIYIYIYICRALAKNFRKIRFKKFGKNNVSTSLLSKHQMGVPNAAGVHGGTVWGLVVLSPWWAPGVTPEDIYPLLQIS